MERLAYSIKYGDIADRWNIDKEKVDKLIHAKEVQLIDEILNPAPLKISGFYRDNRTDEQYYYDILDGRLVEGFICEWFHSKGFNAERVGADADDIIQRDNQRKITSEPDIRIGNLFIEVKISRQGKRRKYHIKENQAKKIKDDNNLLMFIAEDQYIVVGSEQIDEDDIEYNYLWGGKKAYVIRPNEQDYILFSQDVTWLQKGGNIEII